MLFGIDSLYFWLAVIIISIAAEAATLGLCGIWFAAGGAAALVAATFGASIWMQLVIFVLLSAVMLLLVRPLFSRFLKEADRRQMPTASSVRAPWSLSRSTICRRPARCAFSARNGPRARRTALTFLPEPE